MHELSGKLNWAVVWQVLYAILLCLPLSATICHAQCYDGPINATAQINLSPEYWAPGQSYNVVVTNPQGYFFSYSSPNYTPGIFVLTYASYVEGNYTTEDPYVTASNLTYVSPTEVTFTATVASDAPTEFDGWAIVCPGQTLAVSPSISITPCALAVAPTIASVEPDTWTAGQSTNITVTGTGFMPTSNVNSCIQSFLDVTAGSENVAVSSVTVVSSTQITATVQPQITDPAETATVTVSNSQYNDPAHPLKAIATAQIVPTTCPVPQVTAVSPDVWFTGQTYRNVTITGTNFTTTGAATPICPATTVAVTTPSGVVIALGNVTVNSSTKITISSVKPPTSEANESATVTVGGAATYNTQIENPQPSIATLQYTNSQPLWLDSPENSTPVAKSQTVWTPSSSSQSVFVSGNKINATATFGVTPLTSALSGARIEGSVDGLGLLVASGVSIPAGATSITVNLTGDTAFPSSTTAHYSALGVTWSFSPSGQACSSGRSVCEPAGSTSSEVYVTLAAPSGLSEGVMPLTAVMLGIGDGGATTPTAAFQNTWQQFAGPANVNGWDGRPLYYYQQGVGFSSCATNSVGLLTQSNGSGQCGSWAHLFMDALAVNGISSNWTTVKPTVADEMLVNSWSFSNSPTYTANAPWEYNFTPVVESEGFGMVPLPPNSVFGDLTNQTGIPGQNSPTPSEKFFVIHYIVKAPSNLTVGGPYFDPSYGATYANPCDFESKAVAGYADRIAGQNAFYVEKPTGACNVTIAP